MKQLLSIALLCLCFQMFPGTSRAVSSYNGVNFDGSNDYIQFSSSSVTAYTIECWVKFTGSSAASNNIIVYTNSSGPFSGFSHQLYTNSSGNFVHYTYDGAGKSVVGTTVATTNQWYHVAISATNSAQMHLYVNGVEEGTPLSVGTVWTGGDRYFIGINSPLGATLNGTVDELRMWTRALCQGELVNNMNGELPSPTTQTGLYRYYKFNQGFASGTNTGTTTANDYSVNASNGTLNNFALSGSTSNWVAGATVITGTLTSFDGINNVANASTSNTVTISGSTSSSNCGLISTITPTGGGTAVTGSVTSQVIVDPSVQSVNGQPYVTRHYEITPTTNPNTSTADITLYFSQADFNAFNTARGSLPSLPTNTSDVANAANIRISQFHGTSTGGSAPGNYPTTWGGVGPAHVLLTPSSATYNSTYSRWEVVVSVTGFSGFFASSTSTPLPVGMTGFSATLRNDKDVLLNWSIATPQTGDVYIVERSEDGASFNDIGSVQASSAKTYSFHDYEPLAGKSYYRLRISEAGGQSSYSDAQSIFIGSRSYVQLSPNPAKDYVEVRTNEAGLSAILTDMQGREQSRVSLQNQSRIDISRMPSGFYWLKLSNGQVLKLVKE